MRLFLAIEPTAEDRSTLAQLQQRLAASRADVGWVAPENLHVTLRFLGDVEASTLSALIPVVQEIPAGFEAPRLQLEGLGSFPGRGAPRVVWCGVSRGAEVLRTLVARVNAALEGFGFAPEARRYSPHITLGRVRSSRNVDALQQEMQSLQQPDFTPFVPRGVTLFESHLRPQGPRYVVRNVFPFQGG